MTPRSINPSTQEPNYTCDTCNMPVVPGDTGTYQKDHLFFCSVACLYTYYEGEPATHGEEYENESLRYLWDVFNIRYY